MLDHLLEVLAIDDPADGLNGLRLCGIDQFTVMGRRT